MGYRDAETALRFRLERHVEPIAALCAVGRANLTFGADCPAGRDRNG
jgi:hypothetical protein